MTKLFRVTTVPISLQILLKDQLRFMNDHFNVVAISSGGKALERVKKDEKVRTVELNMTRQISPVKDLFSIFKMIRLILKEKPEIVHSHTPKAGLVAMISAFITRVPIRIHTVAGLPLMEKKGISFQILKAVEKIVYFCSTEVWPNSNGLKDYILEQNLCSSKKLKVLNHGSSNGIDTEFFSPTLDDIREVSKKLKNELGINEEDFVFIFTGRLVKDKGCNELISAFKKLQNTQDNLKLLMLGDYEKELSALEDTTLSEIDNNDSILTPGFIDDIRPYMYLSNVFVFPTYREGFPNSLIQALALGMPSLTTNINGCNELIDSYTNGILVDPKSEDQLHSKMLELLEDSQLRDRLAKVAREKIVANYDRKAFHEVMLQEYNKIIKQTL